jgi:prephenate dehydratase
MAVQDGAVERAVVPIENALEGSVRATLDTLAAEAPDVRIEAQVTYPIRHCLIARAEIPLDRIERLVSHPQAVSQCRRFVTAEVPQAVRAAAASTADAVRQVSAEEAPWAALGSRLSAERYGCKVLVDGVSDRDDNLTRFVWLARAEALGTGSPAAVEASTRTSIVFWGFDDDSPGALVARGAGGPRREPDQDREPSPARASRPLHVLRRPRRCRRRPAGARGARGTPPAGRDTPLAGLLSGRLRAARR